MQKACPPRPARSFNSVWCHGSFGIQARSKIAAFGHKQESAGVFVDRRVFFNHAVFLPLFLPHLLSLPPSAPLRRSLSRVLVIFFDILRFRMRRKLSRDIRMHAGYTQTSTKARPLKALREQKRRVVVCGLIALAAWNNGAGRE